MFNQVLIPFASYFVAIRSVDFVIIARCGAKFYCVGHTNIFLIAMTTYGLEFNRRLTVFCWQQLFHYGTIQTKFKSNAFSISLIDSLNKWMIWIMCSDWSNRMSHAIAKTNYKKIPFSHSNCLSDRSDRSAVFSSDLTVALLPKSVVCFCCGAYHFSKRKFYCFEKSYCRILIGLEWQE